MFEVTHGNSKIEFSTQEEVDTYLQTHGSLPFKEFQKTIENAYDPYIAAQESIKKGREIAEYMLLELNAKAKVYKNATGIAIGSGLISLNVDLENFLNKGALDPDAIGEIQRIVATGQVDSFVDVYANALIQIEEFLEG